MAKKSNNLPAYTTGENLLSLIEVIKKNNKSEESIKALFGKGDSAYTNSKSALKAFGIIENDGFEFTEFGREIAYSNDDNKKQEISKIVNSYEPYELVLNSIITSRGEAKVTDIETIKNLWGKAGFGSTDRNRSEGATLFMGIVDFVGLGKYYIGRGSNQTRVEWVDDIKEKVNALFEERSNEGLQNGDMEEPNEGFTDTNEQDLNPMCVYTNSDKKEVPKGNMNITSIPNITINVNMENWSDEKIKAFFKYAYGKFEED